MTDWKGLYDFDNNLFFNGVTAENGASGSYSWSTAWTNLNNAVPGDVYDWAVNIVWGA